MAAAYTLSGLAGSAQPLKQLPIAYAEQSHVAAPIEQSMRQALPLSTSNTAALLSSAASMPPPAPPPTQPTHPALPPPPPPRSLYQPWHPTCSLQWYATQSPSIVSGLTPQTVAATHRTACLFVSTLSLTLRYPFSVLDCAMALYHRFYARHSMAQYEVRRVAAVCLFLASKVEDAPRRLIELIRQYEMMMQQMADEQDGMQLETKEGEVMTGKHHQHSRQSSVESAAAVASNTQPHYPLSPASPSSQASPVLAEHQRERDKLERLTAREHQLRTEFVSLESEVLLACDFDFTFPLPAHYIRLLVRQLVRSAPLTDSAKGREAWEEAMRQLAWQRAMVKGGEAIVVQAMQILHSVLLPTTAYLHFSPQCIAVLCVLVGCRTSGTDIERLVQLGGWVTIAPPAVDEAEQHFDEAPVELKEEAVDMRFSPSSVTSTTPSFSPLYAVSPTSPTTASPASLSSIQSSPAQPPVLQPTPVVVSTIAATALSSSAPVTSPHTASWIRRLLPDVSVDELVSLFGLLCSLPPAFEPPAAPMADIRRFILGVGKPPPRARVDADVLDVLRVRVEYEAEVSERMEEKRLRDAMTAQKEAEEERRRREEERQSRERLIDESARRRVRDDGMDIARTASSERQPWAPQSPPRGHRGGRGRGVAGWHADRAGHQRPAFPVNREAGTWRGAPQRGGWAGRQQQQAHSQAVGWQSTMLDSAPAPTPLHPLSHPHSHRRPASPNHRRSPSPPPKRKRSLSRSPTRRSSNGRDRDREWERDRDWEREGRGTRESGDRQRRGRSRSLSPDSPSEQYRGSGRAKRHASPSSVRDRGRGRR